MQTSSESILEYICSDILADHSPAYILVDRTGGVTHTGGCIGELLSGPILSGTEITDAFSFVQGLLPLDRSPLTLSHIWLESGMVVTVHIFKTDDGYGLLFIDATEQATMIAEMQQKANELALQQQRK